MMGRELIEGEKLAEIVPQLFADRRAAYLHVHFALDDA
jgi:hypothetical protein